MAFEVDVAAGSASFSYDPVADYAGAVVYVFNRDAGRGVITTADGDGGVPPTYPTNTGFADLDGDPSSIYSLDKNTCRQLI